MNIVPFLINTKLNTKFDFLLNLLQHIITYLRLRDVLLMNQAILF